MRPFDSSIRRQLVVLLIILMLPVIAHLWYAGHLQRRQAINFAELQVETSVRLFASQQQLLVEKTRNMLSLLAFNPELADGASPQCSAALTEMNQHYPEYSTMVVANAGGIITCCSLPLAKPLNIGDRDWYRRILQTKQFVVGSFIISRSSGKASLPFAYPMFDNNGGLRQIVGAALDLSAYDTLLDQYTLPEGSHLLIADRSGTILYASPATQQLVGKALESYHGISLPAAGAASKGSFRVDKKTFRYWLRSMQVGDPDNSIFLVVAIPQQTLFATTDTLQAIHAMTLLATLLLMTGLAWYYGGRLVLKPIRQLVEQTRQISSGRIEPAAPLGELTGEFRILAMAFADMTRQLAAREMARSEAEDALRESERRYRALFEQSPISLWEEDLSALKDHLDSLAASGVNDFDAYFSEDPSRIRQCLKLIKILHVNQASLTLFEAQSEADLLGSVDRIIPESSMHLLQTELVAIAEGEPFAIEVENVTLGGRIFPALINSALPSGYEKSWARVFISVFDLSERYRIEQERHDLERQLQLAQKMETVGTLAGGIAHDFNNILSPIIGYAELSLADKALPSATRSHLTNILSAAQRAKEMVHQILAFSRRQESRKEAVNLAEIAREALELLRSSIPSTIELHAELTEGLRQVYGDGSRLHQVIMNLCTNGYQALKATGGIITVGVCEAPAQDRSEPVYRQPHLLLFVEDTGPGIARELQAKIFDPFFTTKGPGEGSGMGLAVVHRIVVDHGGTIEVISNPGQGARFNIHLPYAERTTPHETKTEEAPLPPGSEHILVVDDEESLTQMVGTVLTKLGYTVTAATSSLEALKLFRDDPYHFDMLLTDQTMPQLTGLKMAQAMLAIRPDLPTILYTGYSETATPELAAAAGISRFLYKPLATRELARTVREALDARLSTAGSS